MRIVMKFGGTSVGSVAAFDATANTVIHHAAEHQVTVVLSAMSGMTNLLLERAAAAAAGDSEGVDAVSSELLAPHREVLYKLTSPGPAQRRTEATLIDLIDDASRLLYSIYVLRELSPRAQDRVVSFGERLSTVLMEAILTERGTPAQAVAADTLIVTDGVYGNAAPRLDLTREKALPALQPVFDAGQVPVVTGFFGADEQGTTTTLGRGGSDYSASILGSVLDADEIWIWTDVDGVLTADPRLVPEARTLQGISYDEATELAYFGAKVIHPKTMHPAVEREIPIWIKNTFHPTADGTRIGPSATNGHVVKAVTSISGMSAVTVEGRGEIGVSAITARIFTTLARLQISVYMISQASSQHSVTFVINRAGLTASLRALEVEFKDDLQLARVLSITALDDLAIVAAVGSGMRGTPGVAGQVFTTMGNHKINIVAIAQGSSELNISFAVEAAQVQDAVRALHHSFGLDSDAITPEG